jgi:hypothetical protein
MSSIILRGDTFHGISVAGRGAFTHENEYVGTYAGQHRDGHACGLGVTTYSIGTKAYAEYGPDGQFAGRYFGRSANGTTGYTLFERGKRKAYAVVFADGSCYYNDKPCAPDATGCSLTLRVYRHGTARSEGCAAVGRARPPSFSCRLERTCATECPKVSVQGLGLLVTVLLARNRQPLPAVAAGVPHAELAAEMLSLPSGLLAMVCEAIVKLKVRLETVWVCVGEACMHCSCENVCVCEGRQGGSARL